MRTQRYRPERRSGDQRTEFQRDRDRILYCSAFRRLAGVTQVVGASEGHPFHNRLTHSMKVAQVARRLAEYRLEEQPRLCAEFAVNAEVAEAAGLAHDLGHPPFGHVGEQEIRRCVRDVLGGQVDGFEGNAQSFRVITKLAVHRSGHDGLNLTRATLNAILKYPWLYDSGDRRKATKWNAYRSEEDVFHFARAGFPVDQRSAEAELMDWADDITYSVHDLEDFYRAGLLPLGRLCRNDAELSGICALAADRIEARAGRTPLQLARDACARVLDYVHEDLHVEYNGSRQQRGALRWFTSFLVGSYVRALTLREQNDQNLCCVEVAAPIREEVEVLKTLMRHYVFAHPTLAAQQEGQRRVVSDLFEILYEAACRRRNRDLIPQSARDLLERAEGDEECDPSLARVRVVIDVIVSMTEEEAYRIHQRLTGSEAGRIRDPIVI